MPQTPHVAKPRGRGWGRTIGLMALLALVTAIGVWTVVTQLLDDLVVELDGGTSSWPQLSGAEVTWLLIGSATVGSVLHGLLSWASVWTRGLDLEDGTGAVTSLAGLALGAAVAAADADGRVAIALWVAYGLLVALCLFRARALARSVGARTDRLEERERLVAVGRTTTADVLDVRFRHTWVGEWPSFRVTARFAGSEGPVTVEDDVLTAAEDAPIVGGTVIAHFEEHDPSGAVLTADPDSLRDPEAGTTFKAPSDI